MTRIAADDQGVFVVEYKHFEGPGFQMEVPTNWFISSSLQFQAIFLAPPPFEGIQPNLAIAVRRIQPDITVGDIAEEARLVQEREYPYFEVFSENDTTDQGGAAFQRLYQWYNRETDQLVLQLQTFVVTSEVLFTLTATRSVVEDTSGLPIDDVFMHMIRSFRLEGAIRAG